MRFGLVLICSCFSFLLHISYVKSTVKKILSDEWVLKLNGGEKRAVDFAKEHDLVYIGKVGSLSDYYRFEMSYERKKRMIDDNEHHDLKKRFESNIDVLWMERQAILTRKKRDYIVNYDQPFVEPVDPMWKDSWYLNRHLHNKNMPDLNITGAWKQGYTGRGCTITILDDGFERNHTDLAENYDPKCSKDLNGNDDDPMPRYDKTNENKHGTRCAGEIGAVANNDYCSIGVAFHSKLGGIRMLDGKVKDSIEAAALSHNRNYVNIYSSSWGPDDNGITVDGPGPLAHQALIDGANKGRNGKGSIFVWAAGNGGRLGDSCSCDGYVNSIYTISITSVTEAGEKPTYAEECTSTLASTYSSGHSYKGERHVYTTDIRNLCTALHSGTSASAPLAVGIIALALEANPNLTWRDIIYLIILTSRPKAIPSNEYFVNSRGFLVSNTFGFGLMDAGRMTEVAKNWVNVPVMHTCTTKDTPNKPRNTIFKESNLISSIVSTDGCVNTPNVVNYIEQVEIVVSIQLNDRGSIQIDLIAPSSTNSTILPKRKYDRSNEGFKSWTFRTVQLFGENPVGNWEILIKGQNETKAQLTEFYINIHGTQDKPVDYEKFASAIQTESVATTTKSHTHKNYLVKAYKI